MVLHRIALPIINASFITASLLYLMFLLVNVGEPELLLKTRSLDVNWQRLPEDKPPTPVAIKPEPLKEVELPPEVIIDDPLIDIEIKESFAEHAIGIDQRKGVLHMPMDNQLVRVLGYPPQYPNVAITRGIEGYVVVGFSVSSSGEVYDAFVIESEPKRVFDRSALKAIAKFKYKARMVNGKPVSTDGQRYLFRYELDKD